MYFLGLQAEQIIWLLFTPQNSAGLHQKKHTERGFAGRQVLKVTYSGMALGNSGHGTGIKLLSKPPAYPHTSLWSFLSKFRFFKCL